MKLRAIIADDEPLARERVRSLLAEEPDVEIVAECANGAQTLKATQEHRPDLLFLDVQMPRLSGFEVLEALKPEQMPVVIFTTAHDEHAIRAFDVNALVYLFKPRTEVRFREPGHRARKELPKGSQGTHIILAGLLAHLRYTRSGVERIMISTSDRIL